MATAETPAQAPAQPRRLSLAEYDEMIREGRFGRDDRFELLDGLLVKKMIKGPRHLAITHRLYNALLRSLPGAWHSRMEAPVGLPTGPEQGAPSRPEPDILVLKGVEGTFDDRHPLPDEIALAVEVASDRRRLLEDRKGLTRYAFNNIPSVWIVNLSANVIEVYTNPTGPVEDAIYEGITVKHPGETIAVPLGGGEDVNLDVGALLA